MRCKALVSFAGFLDSGGFVSGVRGQLLDVPDTEKSLFASGYIVALEPPDAPEAEAAAAAKPTKKKA